MTKFDKTVRPQDDFFGFVNNNWIQDNPIPPSESHWGMFDAIRDNASIAIKEIIDEILETKDNYLSQDQILIKKYFLSTLSLDKNRDKHLKTLALELQKIKSIKNKDELSYYIGYANRHNFSPFWVSYDSIDDKNSDIKLLCIRQSGLSLPNREYYIKNTERMKMIRLEYKKYFNNIQSHIAEHSSINWKNIWGIELSLAKASWSDIKLRDIEKNYNRFTINQLSDNFPNFNWLEYFKGLSWQKPSDNIVVQQPAFVDKVIALLNEQPIESIKDYLSWQLINKLFRWIDEDSRKIAFEFYGRVISGTVEDEPLWKKAVKKADELIIGEILGKEYAARHFPESSKNAVLDIVQDIRHAYHKRIDNISWMKGSTKKIAHSKLDNTRVFIGYPSTWHNLENLNLYSDDCLKNILIASSFLSDIDISTIGKKPDPEKWYMNAHTVNAYYDPNQLVICFPAAILQPPFFNANANYATNIGGIGAIIGHELTHGFDDQGSQFDEHGNVKRWQSNSEIKKFKELARPIIDQANSFEVIPGTFLKGKLVIGEAIADIGGLELAIEALKIKTNNQPDKQAMKELFTNAAIVECGSQRDEYSIQQAATDPHPPSKFRVNCVVSHIDEFYKTYDVNIDDRLYVPPDKRVHIW